jgi:hypothetical protein
LGATLVLEASAFGRESSSLSRPTRSLTTEGMGKLVAQQSRKLPLLRRTGVRFPAPPPFRSGAPGRAVGFQTQRTAFESSPERHRRGRVMVSHGFAKAATFGSCAFKSRPLRFLLSAAMGATGRYRLAALVCRTRCPWDTLGVKLPGRPPIYAPVVQTAEATASKAVECWFESSRAHHPFENAQQCST